MNLVSMNQITITGSEPSKASPQGNNAKESENESAEQNSQVDSVELSNKAEEHFRNTVEISVTNDGQEQTKSVDALIDILA